MALRTSNFTDYLNRICGLCGQDPSSLNTVEFNAFTGFFNRAIKDIWDEYPWPKLCIVEARTPNSLFFIDYAQPSTTPIDAVFNVWLTNPLATPAPRRASFILTQTGIQILSTGATVSPVYVFYRPQVPDYFGTTYSSNLGYAAGSVVYYLNTATSVGNYYIALTIVPPGNVPGVNASYWQVQSINYDFLEYIIRSAYADFLRSDGQNDKAAQADADAQEILMDEIDKVERQQNQIAPPTIYSTHLTSRPLY